MLLWSTRDSQPCGRLLEQMEKGEEVSSTGQTHLSMDRETFCFQGLSLRMPMPKPERKNSSPVVTRSHFCEASNSSTAESQMKAWSLLPAEAESKEPCRACSPHPAHTALDSLYLSFLGEGLPFARPSSVPPPARVALGLPAHLSRTAWMASAALS